MLRMSGELGRLPWEYAKDEIRTQVIEKKREARTLLGGAEKDQIAPVTG